MRIPLTPAILVLAILLSASPADSQLVQNECRAGRVWHLEEAWKWSVSQGPGMQEYHLKAAEALAELEQLNETSACAEWRDDAQPRSVNAQGETVVNRAT